MLKVIFFFILLIFAAVVMFFSGLLSHSSISESVLAIIGISTTFIVGMNVVDAIRLQKIEKRMEEIEKLSSEVTAMKQNMNIALHLTWGMAYLNWNPQAAFKEFQKAYTLALKANDALRAHTCLQGLEKAAEKISAKQSPASQSKKQKVPKEIASTALYKIFKERTEDVFASYYKLME